MEIPKNCKIFVCKPLQVKGSSDGDLPLAEPYGNVGPRLVLWAVMQMDANALGHCAPDCSSWGIPSRGTSLRNFINVAGNMFLPWIQGANMQVSRWLSQ